MAASRTVARWLGYTAAIMAWTFAAGSCAGIVTMSGAHSSSGEWPVGATIALVAVCLVWLLVPFVLWRSRRAPKEPGLPTRMG